MVKNMNEMWYCMLKMMLVMDYFNSNLFRLFQYASSGIHLCKSRLSQYFKLADICRIVPQLEVLLYLETVTHIHIKTVLPFLKCFVMLSAINVTLKVLVERIKL